MLVVTTENLPGYTVRHVYGQIMGICMRTRNPFMEGMRRLDNGEAKAVKMLTRWRRDALRAMIGNAREQGANAVIGMRFDHRNVGEMWEEICAYGTAVYVEPVPDAAATAGVAADGAVGGVGGAGAVSYSEPVQGRASAGSGTVYPLPPAEGA